MRSQELIPDELRRWFEPPRLNYVLTGIGLVIAVVLCVFGIRKVADARLVPGTTQLTDVEQDRVARMLLAEGLSQYEFSDGVLMVPNGQRTDYLNVVRKVSVGPRDPANIIERVKEDMSPFLSREERLRRIQVAEGEMVAELLRAIDGVDDVYVHFDEATVGGLRQHREIKAVVSVRPTTGRVIDARLLSSIRRTVAAHKAGLVETNVTVSNLRTGDSYDGSVMPLSGASQTLAIEKATLEQAWQNSVSRVLRFIPGAQVETTVDLEPGMESSDEMPVYRASRLAVAVSVPVHYYHGLWQQNAANKSAGSPTAKDIAALELQTREKIESLVNGLNETGVDAPVLNVAVFQELHSSSPIFARMKSPMGKWFQRHSDKFMQGLMILLAAGLVFFAFRDLFYEDVDEDDEEADSMNKLRVAPETAVGSPVARLASGKSPDVLASSIKSPSSARMPGSAGASGALQQTSATGYSAELAADDESRKRDLAAHQSTAAAAKALATVDGPHFQGENAYVNAELTDLVRENPQAASAMLKSWVEKAG